MFHFCCLSMLFELIWMSIELMIFLLVSLAVTASVLFLPVLLTRILIRRQYKLLHPNNEISVGFFHPYCNAGGGGERVLWCAIKAIQTKYPKIHCVVYTGDMDATPDDIIDRIKQRFNITLDRPPQFFYLSTRFLVESILYPYFTLLGQSLGSCILGGEALLKFVPTIYLDTMGYAFTIPIFKYLGGCKVGCYVHFPTISTDMLKIVADRTSNLTNTNRISSSPFLSRCKLIYYYIFAFLYGLAGKTSQVTMVNSSWTKFHILSLWQNPHSVFRVYPPCDVTSFVTIPLSNNDTKETRNIVSVGQFRPEKDHNLQLRAFEKFLSLIPETDRERYRLVLIGSCRNEDDENRVEDLKKLAKELTIDKFVEFKLNLSFSDLKNELEAGIVGLHTMWNEHFGIGVVECMAAGLIVLAHSSGGPLMDIVTDYDGKSTGFLASDIDSFAEQLKIIFELTSEEKMKIRENGRKSVIRFSESEFNRQFLSAIQPLIPINVDVN